MYVYLYKNNSLITRINAPSIDNYLNYCPSQYKDCIPSDTKYDKPITQNNIVRNAEREDEILILGKIELLEEGEIIVDNKIVVVPKPVDFYKPVWQSPNWIEGATLEECQQIKRKELQEFRDSEIITDYDYNSKILQADLKSQNKLFQAQVLGVGTSEPIEWVLADNTTALFNNQDLINIVNGIAVREQQTFTKFNTLYGQVLGCETIEEIKLINWN